MLSGGIFVSQVVPAPQADRVYSSWRAAQAMPAPLMLMFCSTFIVEGVWDYYFDSIWGKQVSSFIGFRDLHTRVYVNVSITFTLLTTSFDIINFVIEIHPPQFYITKCRYISLQHIHLSDSNGFYFCEKGKIKI